MAASIQFGPKCDDCGLHHKGVEPCCPLTLYVAGPVLSDYMLVDHTGLSIDFCSVQVNGKAGHLSTVTLELPWGQCKVVAGRIPDVEREFAYRRREGALPSYQDLLKKIEALQAELAHRWNTEHAILDPRK